MTLTLLQNGENLVVNHVNYVLETRGAGVFHDYGSVLYQQIAILSLPTSVSHRCLFFVEFLQMTDINIPKSHGR